MHRTQNLYELLSHSATTHPRRTAVVKRGKAKISCADFDHFVAEIYSDPTKFSAASSRVAGGSIRGEIGRE